MSLIFVDGFDHYATADILKKWSSAANGPAILPTDGRRGGGSIQFTAGDSVAKIVPSANNAVIGAAVKPITLAGLTRTLFSLFSSGSLQCSLNLNEDATLSVYRGTTLIATSTAALPIGTYSYLEWKVTIANSIAADSCVVRVNNIEVLNVAAGSDLQELGADQYNAVQLFTSSVSTADIRMDDFYYCTQAGATNNDFLGDVRIDPLYPNGAGNYQDFTPSTGTDHAALVDEHPPVTTDYLTGPSIGSKETLTLDDLTSIGPVLGVQVSNFVAKSDVGACIVQNKIRSGAVDQNGASFAPSTTALYNTSVHELNPDGNVAWTLSTLNALEAGMEVMTP